MHFDDRLATVLRHRTTGKPAARTQFRQFLDLLGRKPDPRTPADQNLLASAWLRLGALGEILPASERALMIGDPGLRFRNPELAAHLAEDEPDVAVAALARAELSDEDWQALIPRLPIRARGFLRLRRDMPASAASLLERLGIHDRGLPLPPADVALERESQTATPIPAEIGDTIDAEGASGTPTAEFAEEPADSQIGVLVKRIEAFRHARRAEPAGGQSPRLPLDETRSDQDQPRLFAFSFTADAEGRIDWADGAIAPMMVGRRLTGDRRVTASFARHQPIRDLPMTLEGGQLITGDWIVDASPRFTAPGGRFYGYAGKFRRPALTSTETPIEAGSDRESEADRIRQLLHELRTPVNAIQGFSEIIQQQLFGPTPHEYRALAATIAGDSARILAGFDELDRLARLETGTLDIEEGATDFRAMVQQTSAQLQEVLKPRSSGIVVDLGKGTCLIPISDRACEALGWRLLATLVSAVGAGESIHLTLQHDEADAVLRCELPKSLSESENIFAASARAVTGSLSAGVFGTGFALRLVRAEAKAAGGDLTRVDNVLMLRLPRLADDQTADLTSTAIAESPSEATDGA